MIFRAKLYIEGEDVIVDIIQSNNIKLDKAYFNIYYDQNKVKKIPPTWASIIGHGSMNSFSFSMAYSGSEFYVDGRGFGVGFFNFNASEDKHIIKIPGLNKEETFNKIKKLFNYIEKHNILNKIINELGSKETLL